MIREVYTCDLCKKDRPLSDVYHQCIVTLKSKTASATLEQTAYRYKPSHSPDFSNGTQVIICNSCVKDIKDSIA